MTPGETWGFGEMLFIRAPKAAILHLFCIAAYGALLIFIAFQPRVSPGVIIGSPLRG